MLPDLAERDLSRSPACVHALLETATRSALETIRSSSYALNAVAFEHAA